MTSFFSAEGGPIWITFRRLVQNDMFIAVIWSKSKPEVEFQYGGRLGKSSGMSSQSHIAGCCHVANSMTSSQSHVSHCRCYLGEFTVMIPVPRATLQGVRIPSAILNIVFRHILFLFFKCS